MNFSDAPNSSIRQDLKRYPTSCGVYMMKDGQGEVIYVGKAKNLRARIRQYFSGHDGRSHVEYLVRKISEIETIVTKTERQAFVLERDLVTKLKPRYNIRLKDDKAYLSLRIDKNEEWPRLELVRKIENDGALYFGPYAFSYELRQLLEIVNKTIPLRSCTNTVFYNRKRPCLEYQIKRCAGPCCLPVDRAQYMEWVQQAIKILEGKTSDLIRDLNKGMERASNELRFEEAASIRDKIAILQNSTSSNEIISHRGENRDVFGFYREGELVAITIIFVRNGKICNSRNFHFADVHIEDPEILESVMIQFYEANHELPGEILIPFELRNAEGVKEWFTDRFGEAIDILLPKKGLKSRLVEISCMNAKQNFASRFEAEARSNEALKQIAKQFGLTQVPRRIECVDISNLQGSDIVSGIVSFYDGNPDKSNYKKYIITGEGKPDDFGSIFEVVSRRLSRGKIQGDLPDLLIIDGGMGQLSAALNARNRAEIQLDIISLAKMRLVGDMKDKSLERKPERVFVEGREDSIPLVEDDEATKLLQRIRDEAHRFSITFHRQRRSKRVFESALDSIAGIGPERRGRLLRYYGGVDKIRSAEPSEVAKIGRMPLTLANKVLRKLNT